MLPHHVGKFEELSTGAGNPGVQEREDAPTWGKDPRLLSHDFNSDSEAISEGQNAQEEGPNS